MAFTSTLPLVLRGAVFVPNTALSAKTGRGGVDARQAELIASMYRGTALATPGNEALPPATKWPVPCRARWRPPTAMR